MGRLILAKLATIAKDLDQQLSGTREVQPGRNVPFVLRLFGRSQFTFIAFSSQLINTKLRFGIGLQLH